MEYMRTLPENTVGMTYADWLDREGVSSDTRSKVRICIRNPRHLVLENDTPSGDTDSLAKGSKDEKYKDGAVLPLSA
jgi:hypothetical protein